MTGEQQRQIMGWLKDKFPSGMPCPLCKGQHYGTGAVVYPPTSYPLNAGNMARQAVAEVVCKTCGYVLQFKCSQVGIDLRTKHETRSAVDSLP